MRAEINTLSKINFVERYLKLSSKYDFDLSDRFQNFSNDEALKLFGELGYEARYLKSDDFYRITEGNTSVKFQFNFVLKSGIVEFIWGVWIEGIAETELSGPWSVVAENAGYQSSIRKPIFRNYKDLKEILTEAFGIYEDFKKELLRNS